MFLCCCWISPSILAAVCCIVILDAITGAMRHICGRRWPRRRVFHAGYGHGGKHVSQFVVLFRRLLFCRLFCRHLFLRCHRGELCGFGPLGIRQIRPWMGARFLFGHVSVRFGRGAGRFGLGWGHGSCRFGRAVEGGDVEQGWLVCFTGRDGER